MICFHQLFDTIMSNAIKMQKLSQLTNFKLDILRGDDFALVKMLLGRI
ncbi:hypothetical protein P20495_1943 [Pseudoalteromonas sp. BSi20495]|nr:hypothetical protein P20495_1943 [Pseudoalteromonas sp. BSi20495]